MITGTVILIGKILAMLLLVGAMVIVLLGIGHIFHTDDLRSVDDTNILRHDVDENEEVISNNSVFYNFLVKTNKKKDEPKK